MIFGKIDYINLLPFYVFLKRRLRRSSEKAALQHKRGVPSQVNLRFRRKKVDAAFISSIRSKGKRCTDAGIVADGPVLSVLLVPGKPSSDPASETSNRLARVLGLEGRVIIGDAALKAWYDGVEAVDLGAAWKEKTGLPFVFARLCYNRKPRYFRKLSRDFLRVRPKIPRYILKRYSLRSGIPEETILIYLGHHIKYRIGPREKKGLTSFLRRVLTDRT